MTNIAKFIGNEMQPFDLLFRNFFDSDSFFAPALNSQIKYPVDIYEDDKSLNIEIAVAGIDKKDIQIEELDGEIRVSYNKEEEQQSSEGQHYIQRSIAKRSFSHGWKIGHQFDAKNIDAKMDKGILKISIPRTEEKPVVKNQIKIK